MQHRSAVAFSRMLPSMPSGMTLSLTRGPGKMPNVEPVTALIVRDVGPDRIRDFEKWIAGFNQVADAFDGCRGTEVIRSRDHDLPEYVVVVRFDDCGHLGAWMGSNERAEWMRKAKELTTDGVQVQEVHGLVPCFSLPDPGAASTQPARYKMTLLTILALYPPLLALSTLLMVLFRRWPRPLLIFLSVVLLVPAMTYVLMPWMTRLFRSWLYPGSSARWTPPREPITRCSEPPCP